MKKLSILKLSVVLVVVVSLFIVQSNAAVDSTLQKNCANTLVKLQLLKGYEDGTLRLENKIKRSEFIALAVRMLGYDKDTDIANIKVPYTDIRTSHWAYNYIKIAIKYSLVEGYPDNTIRPDNYVTYAEALALQIRILGYDKSMSGTWPNNVINKASQLGLSKNIDLKPDKQITRGEMSVIVYNSLDINFSK